MDKEQVVNKVQEFEKQFGWYQNIELGEGLNTKSKSFWGEDLDHPKRRWSYIEPAVPKDMTGMSVLDIGCNAGFISFEAKKRGADYVCGVDLKPQYIEQAKFCADVLNYDVDFRVMDVVDLGKLDRQFDFVFFVGLLYHCKYIFRSVETVASLAKSTILCETAIEPKHKDESYISYVSNDPKRPGHWHPTMGALKELFVTQGFTKVDPVFSVGGRGGVLAKKLDS